MGYERFRDQLRDLRGDLSFRRFAKLIAYDHALISRVENGVQRPSLGLARALDQYAGEGDRFVELLLDDTTPGQPARRETAGSPWEVLDVIRRLRASELGEETLESLGHAVHELCRQYPYRPAAELRTDALELMRTVARLRARRMTLGEHRELLDTAAWLALLVGCIEYDMGLKAAAETTRHAASSLARETGSGEVQAWAHEIACWMALTQGRYEEVIDHARAGRALAPNSGVAVQLVAQEAKALARMGDAASVRSLLDQGRRTLERMPEAEHPEHHFVVDPTKWDFYAMDCSRVVGENVIAEEHADEVLRVGRNLDGSARWPMRVAEAQITKAVVAARGGDLERAVTDATAALEGHQRQCIPSLLMTASELEQVMVTRYAHDARALDWRNQLEMLRTESA